MTFALSFYGDPFEIEDEWRTFEQRALCSLFQSFRWQSSWWRTCGRARGEVPVVVVGRDASGATAFILPLAVSRWGGIDVLTWQAQDHSAYNMGLYRRSDMDAIDGAQLRRALREAGERCRSVAAVHLLSQPMAWDGIRNPLLGLRARNSATKSFDASLTTDFDGFFATKFSGASRRKLGQLSRGLAKLGAAEFGVAKSTEERLQVLETFFEQKSAQLSERGSSNVFADPHIQEFYRQLVLGDSTDQSFELAFLRVGGRAVCTLGGILFNGRFYSLTMSMALDHHRKFSPGELLRRDQIARHCRAGTSIYDFGPGDGFQKERWYDREIALFETYVTLRAVGLPATALRRLGTYAKYEIKRSPKLLSAARWTRQLLNATRRRAKAAKEHLRGGKA